MTRQREYLCSVPIAIALSATGTHPMGRQMENATAPNDQRCGLMGAQNRASRLNNIQIIHVVAALCSRHRDRPTTLYGW